MREGGSGSGGREGRLRKGTSKEWMDGAKERGQGGSERREEGATERGRREREEHGRKGDREAGKLQGRYPEEDTGQQPCAHKTTHNAALAIATLVLRVL